MYSVGDGKTVEGFKQRCDKIKILVMEVDYLGRNVGVRKLKKINMEDKKAHWKVWAIQTKGQGYLLQHYLRGKTSKKI